MPLTFAHPGFVFPLQKKFPNFFVTEALVIGSVVPDMDIVFRFSNTEQHIFDYSLFCVFFQLLPLAWLMGAVYHFFVKKQLAIFFHEKIAHAQDFFSINYFFRYSLSVLLAVFLHLFLDAISHPNAWICAYVVCMKLDMMHLFDAVYFFFWYAPQFLFSIAGFVLIFYYYPTTIKHVFHVIKQINWHKKTVVFIVLCLLFCVKFFLLHSLVDFTFERIVTDGIATIFMAVLLWFGYVFYQNKFVNE